MRTLIGVVVALPALGCGDKLLTEGLEEPFSVHGAQLIEATLPGQAPLTTEQINDGVRPEKPFVNGLVANLQLLRPHLAGVGFSGLVSDDAVAVGLQLEGQGSGYWVFPAGAPDAFVPGFLTWSGLVDFHEVPPGRHRLLAAAIDARGNSGTQAGTTLCIQRPVPDNGNVCDPRRTPPGIVVSLTWNRPVDLDLLVASPTGDLIEAKSPASGPLTPPPTQRLDRDAPGAGYLDVDSNRECVPDGRQRENVIFNSPVPGRYRVYANLHDSCGQDSVQYEVSVHARTIGAEADTFDVVETRRRVGSLIALQANGSRARGTYVTEFVITE
jgi:hypothetical protein